MRYVKERARKDKREDDFNKFGIVGAVMEY